MKIKCGFRTLGMRGSDRAARVVARGQIELNLLAILDSVLVSGRGNRGERMAVDLNA